MDRHARLMLITLVISACGPDTLVVAPCMPLTEVERLSEGFDPDDFTPPEDDEEAHEARWDSVKVILDGVPFYDFGERVVRLISHRGRISQIRIEADRLHRFDEWDILARTIADLEAKGFTVARGDRERFLSRTNPQEYRGLDLRRGDLEFVLLVEVYERGFTLRRSASSVRECRSPTMLKWNEEHQHVWDDLY